MGYATRWIEALSRVKPASDRLRLDACGILGERAGNRGLCVLHPAHFRLSIRQPRQQRHIGRRQRCRLLVPLHGRGRVVEPQRQISDLCGMRRLVAVIIDQRRIPNERLPRIVEMSEPLRHGRQLGQDFRVGGEALGGLLTPVPPIGSPGKRQRPAVEPESRSWPWLARCRFQRLERLAQVGGVARSSAALARLAERGRDVRCS